jgi:hypothetical protein
MTKDIGCFAREPLSLERQCDPKSILERNLIYSKFLEGLDDKDIRDGEAFVLLGYRAVGFRRDNVSGCVVEASTWGNLVLIQPSNEPKDWIMDSLIFKVPYTTGKVHGGFLLMASQIKWKVLRVVGELDPFKKKSYSFFGYSLGAAVGVLMADILYQEKYTVEEVLTAAAPKVGNTAFVEYLSSRFNTRRLVNRYDIVDYLPPCLGYKHAGRTLYMDNGKVSSTPPYWKFSLIPVIKYGVDDHYLRSYKAAIEKCLASQK